MNSATSAAFAAGSGVSPITLRLVLTLTVAALALTAAAWIVVQLLDAYRNETLTTTETISGVIRTGILLGLVFVAITVV